MADEPAQPTTWSKTKYIVQSRVVSKGVAGDRAKWQRMPQLFDSMYDAMLFRDRYDAFVKAGNYDGPKTNPFEIAMNELIAMIVKMVKEDGGYMETRILKRTITDEVIEEIEKVKIG